MTQPDPIELLMGILSKDFPTYSTHLQELKSVHNKVADQIMHIFTSSKIDANLLDNLGEGLGHFIMEHRLNRC
jgi:hypothetical protein